METPKLKLVRGWTLLRSEADYHRWHKDRSAYHATLPPCFPCFVKEVLASVEETSYEYLSGGMIADLQKAIDA